MQCRFRSSVRSASAVGIAPSIVLSRSHKDGLKAACSLLFACSLVPNAYSVSALSPASRTIHLSALRPAERERDAVASVANSPSRFDLLELVVYFDLRSRSLGPKSVDGDDGARGSEWAMEERRGLQHSSPISSNNMQ